jgi:hypothetical protein
VIKKKGKPPAYPDRPSEAERASAEPDPAAVEAAAAQRAAAGWGD